MIFGTDVQFALNFTIQLSKLKYRKGYLFLLEIFLQFVFFPSQNMLHMNYVKNQLQLG